MSETPETTLKQKIALLLFGLLMALCVAEVGARLILGSKPKASWIEPEGVQVFQTFPDGRHVYKPGTSWSQNFPKLDKEGMERESYDTVQYDVNDLGMRGAMPLEGVPNILCLGDSFTFGQAVPNGDPFPNRLEEALKERGLECRVLNGGVQGYSLKQSVDFYLAYDHKPVPETLVLTFFLNDMLPTETQAFRTPSALLNLILERQRAKAYFPDIRESLVDLSLFEQELLRAQAHAQAQGSRMVLMLFPILEQLDAYPFREEHQRMVRVAQKNGIEVLDLLSIFEGRDASELWAHQSDHHPNHLAHKETAESVASLLIDQDSVD